MCELKKSKDELIKLYNNGTESEKALLIKLYGEEAFEGNIFDKVKSVEDAYQITGIDRASRINANDDENDIAFKDMKVVALALNGKWTPNWDDSNEKKWGPWFNMAGGFAFDVSYCDSTVTSAGLGSRLCFKDEKTSNYAGTQFLSVYKKLLK